MKTMKKIVCALMTLVLLLSSVPAVFADEAKTIDQDAACSLTVWKFDYTNARKDGVWDEDAFPSTGWQESYALKSPYLLSSLRSTPGGAELPHGHGDDPSR